jgi:hypothetical protein
MRSGSITGTGGRCGNPNCHCHKDGDPGHGPCCRLTRKVNGKTVTETFASPSGLAKAQREVAECLRFRELGEQLLDINERICRLRPTEDAGRSAQEKRRPKRSGKNPPANQVSCPPSFSASAGQGANSIWKSTETAIRAAMHRGRCTDAAFAVRPPGCRPPESALFVRSRGADHRHLRMVNLNPG